MRRREEGGRGSAEIGSLADIDARVQEGIRSRDVSHHLVGDSAAFWLLTMSSARYAPVKNADHELDAAFDDDDELENDEQASSSHAPPVHIPGAYDFEREYDFPPPGSPPTPSARALPNDYGNSNGLLPDSTPARPAPRRPSFFRRAVGALLPSHYIRVPSSSHIVGAGTENDGVFANVVAKPQRAQPQIAADGSIYMAPEETTNKDVPPVSPLLLHRSLIT